jgi:hypothetical protein
VNQGPERIITFNSTLATPQSLFCIRIGTIHRYRSICKGFDRLDLDISQKYLPYSGALQAPTRLSSGEFSRDLNWPSNAVHDQVWFIIRMCS